MNIFASCYSRKEVEISFDYCVPGECGKYVPVTNDHKGKQGPFRRSTKCHAGLKGVSFSLTRLQQKQIENKENIFQEPFQEFF